MKSLPPPWQIRTPCNESTIHKIAIFIALRLKHQWKCGHPLYLKMTDKTRQNVADSFNEGTFRLSLTRLGSIYTIELL